MVVTVMNTLSRRGRKPSRVRTIVIHYMVSPNPLQLVALMHTQLRQRRLVPPILPILTATALARILRHTGHRPTALARVNLEPPVRRHERRVAPVRLHAPPCVAQLSAFHIELYTPIAWSFGVKQRKIEKVHPAVEDEAPRRRLLPLTTEAHPAVVFSGLHLLLR
ncbi:Xyloglucan endotransglucosylase/hydrolase protein 9 [Senna tora]|uniref:Xyloglucan endotransglucosylase/hydrolase protein 9 n=1 Tax=Senna tora TaxID=362788 RepID=A0A834TNH4_9FABA|nr:Xyloglucan endotransglucosylase/hydrolase protein 9 [Senna tora]